MRVISVFICVLYCILLISCQNSSDSDGGGLKVQIPWPTGKSSSYEIQDVEVKTLKDPQKLQGDAADVFLEPSYTKSSGLEANEQNLRFVESDEVLIPANATSLQLAAVYAHLEKLRELDVASGTADVLKWPRKVGVNVNVSFRGKGDPERNNAAYVHSQDLLLVVPYDKEGLPITLNAGILGHEHFHALFQHLVLKHISEERAAGEYNQFVLAAWDEGFADFWAWLYTGDVEFMKASLPKHSKARTLNAEFTSLPGKASLKAKLKKLNESETTGEFYRLGTRYARYFYQTVKRSGLSKTKSSREEVARLFIEMLKDLRQKVNSSSGDIDLNLPLDSFMNTSTKLKSKADCRVMRKTKKDSDSQSEVCQ